MLGVIVLVTFGIVVWIAFGGGCCFAGLRLVGVAVLCCCNYVWLCCLLLVDLGGAWCCIGMHLVAVWFVVFAVSLITCVFVFCVVG